MLDIFNSVGSSIDVAFNPIKSKCLLIGPTFNTTPSLVSIGNIQLQWTQQITYLGIILSNAKSFQVDFSDIRRKFFSAVNSILSKCSFTSELLKLQLLESHCLPILTYATESLNLSNLQLSQLNAWWNSAYRRIFGFHQWESVRELILMLGRLDLHHIVDLRSLKFIFNISKLAEMNPCDVNNYCYTYTRSPECYALFGLYGCKYDWCFLRCKEKIYLSFSSI